MIRNTDTNNAKDLTPRFNGLEDVFKRFSLEQEFKTCEQFSQNSKLKSFFTGLNSKLKEEKA